MDANQDAVGADYAIALANSSFEWYRHAAIKARRYFRISEVFSLVVSAAIPVWAVFTPGDGRIPAVLGGLLVVVAGLRAVFHWSEDYVRFSRARETVEMQRRLYRTGTVPYDNELTRDSILTTAITQIEQQEMGVWAQLVNPGGD